MINFALTYFGIGIAVMLFVEVMLGKPSDTSDWRAAMFCLAIWPICVVMIALNPELRN